MSGFGSEEPNSLTGASISSRKWSDTPLPALQEHTGSNGEECADNTIDDKSHINSRSKGSNLSANVCDKSIYSVQNGVNQVQIDIQKDVFDQRNKNNYGILDEQKHSDKHMEGKESMSNCSIDISESQRNNTKLVSGSQKQVKIGIKVNDLNASGGDASHADNCDVLTAEEQLAAMLNRPKLHAKRKSGESGVEGDGAFSIHMAGDSLVIMSDGQAVIGAASAPAQPSASYITERNLNTNESKFDTSTASSSQSTTDNDSPSKGLTYDLDVNLSSGITLGGAESPYSRGVSTPNTVQVGLVGLFCRYDSYYLIIL